MIVKLQYLNSVASLPQTLQQLWDAMLLALSFHGKTCLGCCQGCGAQEEERNSVFPNSKPRHCVDTRWSEVSHQALSWSCVAIPSSSKSCRQAGSPRKYNSNPLSTCFPPLSEFRISQCARRSCPRPPASLTKYTLKFNFQSCFFLKIQQVSLHSLL